MLKNQTKIDQDYTMNGDEAYVIDYDSNFCFLFCFFTSVVIRMVSEAKLMSFFRLESMQMKQEEELVSALATQNLQIEVNYYS